MAVEELNARRRPGQKIEIVSRTTKRSPRRPCARREVIPAGRREALVGAVSSGATWR